MTLPTHCEHSWHISVASVQNPTNCVHARSSNYAIFNKEKIYALNQVSAARCVARGCLANWRFRVLTRHTSDVRHDSKLLCIDASKSTWWSLHHLHSLFGNRSNTNVSLLTQPAHAYNLAAFKRWSRRSKASRSRQFKISRRVEHHFRRDVQAQ